MKEKDPEKISVVIATLGGPTLERTIDSMMSGSVTPDEILISIPFDHAYKVNSLASRVVKILATHVRGQVAQRAYGFTQTQYNMVLQLDDDILFENDSIENLVNHLSQLGRGNVVAPVYYGSANRKCIHKLQDGLVKNIFDCIVCGAPWGEKKMGVVTSIGLNYGVDDSLAKDALFETGWLPGACVISYKADLVTEDFFPFTGKAYCEDIYHSYYRKKKGLRLWVATKTKVYTEEPASRLSKDIVAKETKIRRQYVKMSGGPVWRLRIYELFTRIRSLFHS